MMLDANHSAFSSNSYRSAVKAKGSESITNPDSITKLLALEARKDKNTRKQRYFEGGQEAYRTYEKKTEFNPVDDVSSSEEDGAKFYDMKEK